MIWLIVFAALVVYGAVMILGFVAGCLLFIVRMRRFLSARRARNARVTVLATKPSGYIGSGVVIKPR